MPYAKFDYHSPAIYYRRNIDPAYSSHPPALYTTTTAVVLYGVLVVNVKYQYQIVLLLVMKGIAMIVPTQCIVFSSTLTKEISMGEELIYLRYMLTYLIFSTEALRTIRHSKNNHGPRRTQPHGTTKEYSR